MDFNYLYSLSGLLVGFIVGVTGVGGGSLMTPILILLFKVNPLSAVVIDLFYAAITKATGVAVYSFKKLVDWKIVIYLLLGSIPASLITVYLLSYLTDANHLLNTTIVKVLGVALIFTSIVIFADQLIKKSRTKKPNHQRQPQYHHCLKLTLLGMVLGIVVTISSVGAGALGLAFLSLLYPNYKISKLVAADLAHAVILSLVAGIGHLSISTINLNILAPLLLGSIPGVFIGSNLGIYLPDKIMRPLVASVLMLLGIKFLFT